MIKLRAAAFGSVPPQFRPNDNTVARGRCTGGFRSGGVSVRSFLTGTRSGPTMSAVPKEEVNQILGSASRGRSGLTSSPGAKRNSVDIRRPNRPLAARPRRCDRGIQRFRRLAFAMARFIVTGSSVAFSVVRSLVQCRLPLDPDLVACFRWKKRAVLRLR
jgi:hypothetical protein